VCNPTTPQSRSRLPDIFYAAIEQELDARPDGISEHDLIRALNSRGFFSFLPPPPADPFQLFRAHVLLFHALYNLKDRLSSSQQGMLQIEPLCIRRLPWSAGTDALATNDPLRAYYLDWSNLDATSEDDVCTLIASFWNQLGRFDKREDALAELGLQDPVDDEAIKLAWRRLAMEHHPDRGGDNERLQAINAAVDCLIR
jgi:DnaJ-domain-containing protein 1